MYASRELELAATHARLTEKVGRLNIQREIVAGNRGKQPSINYLRKELSTIKLTLIRYYEEHKMLRDLEDIHKVGVMKKPRVVHHLLNYYEIEVRELEDRLGSLSKELLMHMTGKLAKKIACR